MQTQSTFNRFDPSQLRVVLLAACIAAGVMVGAITIGQTRDDRSASGTIHPAVTGPTYGQIRFLELNTQLPEEATFERAGDASKAAPNRGDRFREINMLPGDDVTHVIPLDDIRFLEMNELPGNDAYTLPFGESPDAY